MSRVFRKKRNVTTAALSGRGRRLVAEFTSQSPCPHHSAPQAPTGHVRASVEGGGRRYPFHLTRECLDVVALELVSVRPEDQVRGGQRASLRQRPSARRDRVG